APNDPAHLPGSGRHYRARTVSGPGQVQRLVMCRHALGQATITETPNGTSSAVNSSKHLCDTSKPAVSQLERYPQKTSTLNRCLSALRYSTWGRTTCQSASIWRSRGSVSGSGG